MNLHACLGVGALPLAMALAIQGQGTQELPAISLRLTEMVSVAELIPRSFLMVRSPVKCDSDGNLYVIHYSRPDPLAVPIEKITREGKLAARFEIRSAPGFEKGHALDFAVGGQGEVYVLTALKVNEGYVVRFTEVGKYDSSFKLEPRLEPQQLAVFPSGELLVSGKELHFSFGGLKRTGRILLAIYDRSGSLLRAITLPREIQWLTNAEPADDGNVYLLMRAVPDPEVFVISPAADVLRRFGVRSRGEGFRVIGMRPAGGKIAIELAKDNPEGMGDIYLYSIIDAQTGERFAEHSPSSEARGIWACYQPDDFTFLSSQGQPPRLAIVRAKP